MRRYRGPCGHVAVNPETTTMDAGDTLLFRCPLCEGWMEPICQIDHLPRDVGTVTVGGRRSAFAASAKWRWISIRPPRICRRRRTPMKKKKKPESLTITGYVLRRTEEPDRDGDVIDLDHLSLPDDPPWLTASFWPKAMGRIDALVMEAEGLRVTGRVVGEVAQRLRRSANPGFSLDVGIRKVQIEEDPSDGQGD